MTEEDAKRWVKQKDNQQKVIHAVIGDSPNNARIAIFMAGIPGAGKTEFVSSFMSQRLNDFIVIEHDKVVEFIDGYTTETYYNFRTAGSTLVTKLFDACLKQGTSFIFDGTLSHGNGYRNIAKALKAGFSVIVIYIHQDAKRAWQLTQDRELVKKRAIEKQGFLNTTNAINESLQNIFTAFKDNGNFSFWIFKKKGAAGMENAEFIAYDHSTGANAADDVESVLAQAYTIQDI